MNPFLWAGYNDFAGFSTRDDGGGCHSEGVLTTVGIQGMETWILTPRTIMKVMHIVYFWCWAQNDRIIRF